ncbi:MAG: hypothetical protein V4494_02295 [Chlamydiota bacterium]
MSFFSLALNQNTPFIDNQENINIPKGGAVSLDKKVLQNILDSKNDGIIRSIALNLILKPEKPDLNRLNRLTKSDDIKYTQEEVLNTITALTDNDLILSQQLVKIFQLDVCRLANTVLTREWNFEKGSLTFKHVKYHVKYKDVPITPKRSITVNQNKFSVIHEHLFQISHISKDQHSRFFKTKIIISGANQSLKNRDASSINCKILFTQTQNSIIESLGDLYLTWAAFPLHMSTALGNLDAFLPRDYDSLTEQPNYYSDHTNAGFDIEYSLLQKMESNNIPSHYKLLHNHQ